MIRYFVGGCVGYVAFLLVAGLLHWAAAHELANQPWFTVALVLVVIPACVQALVGDLVARVLRKRAFDPRAAAGYSLVFAGFVVSIVVVAATALILPFLRDQPSDTIVIASAAAVVSALAVALMRRAKAGSCITCGYQLGTTPVPSRCQECGQATALTPACTPGRTRGLSFAPHACAEQTGPSHAAHLEDRVS